jgi:outer membrane protein assembly complex protein YaeT
MLRRFFLILTVILPLAVPAAAQVKLALADYDHWQAYNGWPIKVIEFPGIHSFSRNELLAVIATEQPSYLRRYIPIGGRTTFFTDEFTSDLYRLRRFYGREGFLKMSVRGYVTASEKKHQVRVKFEVEEGPPLLLEGYRILREDSSDAPIDSARWWPYMPVRIGKRLALSSLQLSADTLAYKLREKGYARARVTYEVHIDSLRNSAHIVFHAYPGHFCRFGATRIIGLKQVNESTARRELAYRLYAPYSPVPLEDTRLQFVRLETFTLVNVRADTSVRGDTLPVWITTEEGWRYRVRFGGGWDSDKAWNVLAEFTDLNFFGSARRFTLSGGLSKFNRSVETRLFYPHAPWHATDITFVPKWELLLEKAYHTNRQTATTILSGIPLRKVRMSLANEIGTEKTRNLLPGPTYNQITAAHFRSVETFSVAWDTRNNPLVSTAGHLIAMNLAESGALYKTDQRWWRAQLMTNGLRPLTHLITFAGRAEWGIMGPLYNNTTTPIEERFYLGGPSSVRGWGRHMLSPRDALDHSKPIGGDMEFLASAEIRQSIWGPFTTAVFADVGNVWSTRDVWKPLDLFPTVGVGVLVLSPVGPVRVDVGFQLRTVPYDKEHWALHFSLGNPF